MACRTVWDGFDVNDLNLAVNLQHRSDQSFSDLEPFSFHLQPHPAAPASGSSIYRIREEAWVVITAAALVHLPLAPAAVSSEPFQAGWSASHKSQQMLKATFRCRISRSAPAERAKHNSRGGTAGWDPKHV